MGEGTADLRLRAVVELAQALATAQTPLAAVRAGARRARLAMGGSFAAISAWKRETGQLRVLVNDGDLAPGEEPEPADESYSVHDFPEIAEFLRGSWGAGGEPHAWVETADGTGASPGGSSWGRAAALRRRGRGSCVVAPIVLHGGAWGELYVARSTEEPEFDRSDAEFATVLAAVIAAGLA